MKKIKKKYILMICLPLVIMGSIFSVILLNNKQNPALEHEFVIDISEKNYRKVYLLDENKYLIPLSVDVSSKEYLVDEIYTIVSDLRDLKVEGFTSVIASDVKINKIELENGILNIDFSKEFLNYQGELEEKIIESLTWSVLDFNEVNGLTISVDGVRLDKMPINGLKLPSVLNKDIGINKYHDMTYDYKGSDNVVVLYQKVVNGNSYFVPVTRKVIKETNEVATIINAFDKDISIMSGLNKVDELSEMTNNEYTCNDGRVSVSLTKDYLIADNLIDSNLYELLMVTFEYNNLDMKVDFTIDQESVSVSGYIDSEVSSVSNIVFNEIEI